MACLSCIVAACKLGVLTAGIDNNVYGQASSSFMIISITPYYGDSDYSMCTVCVVFAENNLKKKTRNRRKCKCVFSFWEQLKLANPTTDISISSKYVFSPANANVTIWIV